MRLTQRACHGLMPHVYLSWRVSEAAREVLHWLVH